MRPIRTIASNRGRYDLLAVLGTGVERGVPLPVGMVVRSFPYDTCFLWCQSDNFRPFSTDKALGVPFWEMTKSTWLHGGWSSTDQRGGGFPRSRLLSAKRSSIAVRQVKCRDFIHQNTTIFQ